MHQKPSNMATSVAVLPLLFTLMCRYAAVSAIRHPGASGGAACTRLFSFGDSITDAGNYATSLSPNVTLLTLPFGKTFFGQPSGRFCDGRLIVDFVGTPSRCATCLYAHSR